MVYASGSESAAATGDYVGVESCIDLRNEEEFEEYVKDCERSNDRRKLSRRRKEEEEKEVEVKETIGDVGGRKKKELSDFPPPITFLARTGNKPSHMPWVMKRYLTDDGRLVIREEKVRYHEYFRAHRADGRLTLQLIPLFDYNFYPAAQLNNSNDTKMVNVDKEDKDLEAISFHVDGNVEDTQVVNVNVKDEEEEEEVVARVMVTSVSMAALCISEGVKNGGILTSASSSSSLSGGGNTCYGFNTLRSSSASSLFHLQAPPPIRPVIS